MFKPRNQRWIGLHAYFLNYRESGNLNIGNKNFRVENFSYHDSAYENIFTLAKLIQYLQSVKKITSLIQWAAWASKFREPEREVRLQR